MFAGLMSRCTRPLAWASASDAHTWRRMWAARPQARAVMTHQGLEIHSLQQLHHEVERLVVSDPEVVQLHGVRRAQVGRRLGFRRKRDIARCAPAGSPLPASRANQLDRRGSRQHAMAGPVDLSHAATPHQLTELVAAHLARPGHLLAERRHHVRDHDRDADQEEVGIVHQQRVDRESKSQVPRARAISMLTGFIDTAMRPAASVFAGVLGTIAANIRTTAPTHEISGVMARTGMGSQ